MPPLDQSGIDAPYPRGGTFSELLQWHLMNGTKADGTPSAQGKPWSRSAFVSKIEDDAHQHEAAARRLRNWIYGETLPTSDSYREIERILFGDSAYLDNWRADLFSALQAARQPTHAISPHTESMKGIASYPGPTDFKTLFCWHLMWGTRPGGDPTKRGKPWTDDDFGEAAGGYSGRTVRKWKNGTRPDDYASIERALFETEREFQGWRDDLYAAYLTLPNFKAEKRRADSKRAIIHPDTSGVADGENYSNSELDLNASRTAKKDVQVSKSDIELKVTSHSDGSQVSYISKARNALSDTLFAAGYHNISCDAGTHHRYTIVRHWDAPSVLLEEVKGIVEKFLSTFGIEYNIPIVKQTYISDGTVYKIQIEIGQMHCEILNIGSASPQNLGRTV